MNEQPQLNNQTSRHYPGTLDFYHPNSKGTGSAVRFEMKPAHHKRQGCFFMEMARQKTLPARESNGRRRAATFDWNHKVIVKLGLTDVCQLLLVLQGKQADQSNNKGLFHDTAEATTVIRLLRGSEYTGFALEVSRKAKQSESQPNRLRLVLTESEALGLALVFEQSMLLLVYGVLTPEPDTIPPAP